MIISASRRTDLPARYSDWLVNRFKEGFVYVRNPMNAHQVSKVSLMPDVVDGIVFWTKNPLPIIDKLEAFINYEYYFQVTINPYSQDVEPNVPSKGNVIIPAVKKLAEKIGSERVVWRYDPIILNSKYTVEYHCDYFEKMMKRLHSSVRKCTFSFVDMYKNTTRNILPLGLHEADREEIQMIAKSFSQIAKSYNVALDTCAEVIDLHEFGINSACCIDRTLFESLLGCQLEIAKDPNQRPECGCVASIDIGMYNTCTNGCKYCYANSNAPTAQTNCKIHNPYSPLLIGDVNSDDKLTERKMKSLKRGQLQLF